MRVFSYLFSSIKIEEISEIHGFSIEDREIAVSSEFMWPSGNQAWQWTITHLVRWFSHSHFHLHYRRLELLSHGGRIGRQTEELEDRRDPESLLQVRRKVKAVEMCFDTLLILNWNSLDMVPLWLLTNIAMFSTTIVHSGQSSNYHIGPDPIWPPQVLYILSKGRVSWHPWTFEVPFRRVLLSLVRRQFFLCGMLPSWCGKGQ